MKHIYTDTDTSNQLPLPSQVKAQSLAWRALLSVLVHSRPQPSEPIWTRGIQARPGASKTARDFKFDIKNLGQTQSLKISKSQSL